MGCVDIYNPSLRLVSWRKRYGQRFLLNSPAGSVLFVAVVVVAVVIAVVISVGGNSMDDSLHIHPPPQLRCFYHNGEKYG